MNAKLPNLELLDYKIKQHLINDKEFMQKWNKYKEEHSYACVDVVFDMFIQMWGNTSGGFETVGGCAMTEEYTIVAHERSTDTYIVCFGDKPAYIVNDAPIQFLEDLKDRQIKGINTAKKYY